MPALVDGAEPGQWLECQTMSVHSVWLLALVLGTIQACAK